MAVLCRSHELCKLWVNISRRSACILNQEVIRVTFKLLDVKVKSSILSSTRVLFDDLVGLILRTVVKNLPPLFT
jgi:hypothetical protein